VSLSQPVNTASPTASGAPSPMRAALRNMFRQPTFILAATVLFIAALTLNGAVQMMQLHFRKEPVALRHPLDEIPPQMGPWLQLSKDQPLDKELQDTLGTDKYVFRDYVDTRHVSAGELAVFKKDLAPADYLRELSLLQSEKPGSVISAAVTYYTGLVDTVPHIPDRCYVAGGYEPIDHSYPTWDVTPPGVLGSYADTASRELQVCFINFEDQTATRSTLPINVAYFFQCNGSYESDAINGVRMRLQDLTERHGYFAKVELKTIMSDQIASKSTMADFLRYALPEIERCLPDWQAVKRSESQAAKPGETAANNQGMEKNSASIH
jgi:hypothetical protein